MMTDDNVSLQQHAHTGGVFFYSIPQTPLQQRIQQAYLLDEPQQVSFLLQQLAASRDAGATVKQQASQLIKQIRQQGVATGSLQAFLQEYNLSSQEGVVLMCIAEALLRIPDQATVDALICDRLQDADWAKHCLHSESWLVNAATWGLMLTGNLINVDQSQQPVQSLKRLIHHHSEGLIRRALYHAIALMGQQFVLAETIEAACDNTAGVEAQGWRYSFDMLGEAALTEADADAYFEAYRHAILQLAQQTPNNWTLFQKPGISIKLSALHPRYQLSQSQRVYSELRQRLFDLVLLAKQHNLSVTIDAEESERLMMSLHLFESVFADPALVAWSGFGLAVQAYQKRAYAVIQWLIALAKTQQKRIPIRLIKGAYWDGEIKRAQEQGLSHYPVFTRKQHTDVSYQACALLMIRHQTEIYPQFATHNAYTVAFILAHLSTDADYEFQRLHGMGEALYQQARQYYGASRLPCRVYAPVGGHQQLLPYLVRRLLENGANTSFVHHLFDEAVSVDSLVTDPVLFSEQGEGEHHPQIPLPPEIYGKQRINAQGFNLADEAKLEHFSDYLNQCQLRHWYTWPLVHGERCFTMPKVIRAPFDQERVVGLVHEADEVLALQALSYAEQAWPSWNAQPVSERAAILRDMANLLEQQFEQCLALLLLEAGKTLADAVGEVREAIDFCRYYAEQAELLLARPQRLAGITGEQNLLSLSGRGPVLCISPWNFPLAIFIGQITAALVCGNTVIAKPAEQTPLIAGLAVQLLHQAGVPLDVLQLLPGEGASLGKVLLNDQRIRAVVFTGSYATARLINQTLAQRPGEIVPFIAETGGINAMVVDSSALPEQVVQDVISSAFNSAGQRCSALRLLLVQQDIAERIKQQLSGAMSQLQVGDPRFYQTDIGPVIDGEAKAMLEAHIRYLQQHAQLIAKTGKSLACQRGYYVAPVCFELSDIAQLQQEVFGPILHLLPYQADELPTLLQQLKASGYALTLGIHSRIHSRINEICQLLPVGNVYINRNMIGAVVGVQPFGGHGLSGTGPKAGGPRYLLRFCTEHTQSSNLTAIGGNLSLLGQS